MQMEMKGRNIPVTDDLRRHAERRFGKIAKQVSDLARLEIEISEERNPAIAERHVAEATLFLKGTTLRASEASREMPHSLKLVSEELARQVKRHRDKRRRRREARSPDARGVSQASEGLLPDGGGVSQASEGLLPDGGSVSQASEGLLPDGGGVSQAL